MPSLANFLHTQLILEIPKPTASFASKTVIVTGANGGLGQEIVKHIVRLGASKVIFACRSVTAGHKAKLQIDSTLECNSKVIEVWQLDLLSPSSIRSFVERANTLPRLDVLVNNAGVPASKAAGAYGTDYTLAVNVIGTFLLALQLIPKLQETAREFNTTPHMTFVGSALYDVAKYPKEHGNDLFSWYKDTSHINMMNQYNLSKLLQLYAVIKLSSIVNPISSSHPNPITINSLDPCFCKTGLSKELKGVAKVFFAVFAAIFARSAEEGAALVVQTAAAGRQTHGLYMRAGAVQEYASIALDNMKAEYIWDLLCQRLEKVQPGVLKNIQ